MTTDNSTRPSKLPSYRQCDLSAGLPAPAHTARAASEHGDDHHVGIQHHPHQHTRNHSDSAASSPATKLPSASAPSDISWHIDVGFHDTTRFALIPTIPCQNPEGKSQRRIAENGMRDSWSGPPPAMITRGHSDTSDWVAEQSVVPSSISIPTAGLEKPMLDSAQQQSRPPITPTIPPIRAFRSSRRSADMNATPVRRSSTGQDSQDETLRALEGFDRVSSQRPARLEQEEQNSDDDSDLFLKLAREESTMNISSNRDPIRRVRTIKT